MRVVPHDEVIVSYDPHSKRDFPVVGEKLQVVQKLEETEEKQPSPVKYDINTSLFVDSVFSDTIFCSGNFEALIKSTKSTTIDGNRRDSNIAMK